MCKRDRGPEPDSIDLSRLNVKQKQVYVHGSNGNSAG